MEIGNSKAVALLHRFLAQRAPAIYFELKKRLSKQTRQILQSGPRQSSQALHPTLALNVGESLLNNLKNYFGHFVNLTF